MLEITRLIDQAEQINERLHEFIDSFPNSEVASAPFSKPWWRKDLPLVAPATVIDWALLVNRHVRHCGSFSSTFSLPMLTDNLNTLTSWSNPASMADSLSSVSSHRAKLFALRQSYAANFSAESAKVAIS
jgi:hypothetical protein